MPSIEQAIVAGAVGTNAAISGRPCTPLTPDVCVAMAEKDGM